MICHICSRKTYPYAEATVLGTYAVQYFQCASCGFVQTETPYWLNEAYSDAITSSDVGMIGRNSMLSKLSRAIVLAFFDGSKKFLDYGGGYGIFVRMMRDYGFDFYLFDKFCANIFANGFSVNIETDEHYELVTAFEVFEHLVNPLRDIEQMLDLSGSILFSTMLIPANNPKPGEWWYYGLDHGQHISLYTHRALSTIAERFHLKLYSEGRFLHLLTHKKINPLTFQLISHYRIALLAGNCLSKWQNRRSLLAEDYLKITGKPLH